MDNRIDIVTRTTIDGRSYSLHLVTNPTIDDVLCVEARLHAYEVQNKLDLAPEEERRVGRDVRDFLIKIGAAS